MRLAKHFPEKRCKGVQILTPRDFLEKVRPDVHVNGYDYGKDCIESDILEKCGAKLHIANFVEGLSTTDIINKINSQKV